RDFHVTGVQTCALPIYAPNWRLGHWLNGRINGVSLDELIAAILADFGLPEADVSGVDGYLSGFVISEPASARGVLEPLLDIFGRSEERRVGKEGGCGCA